MPKAKKKRGQGSKARGKGKGKGKAKAKPKAKKCPTDIRILLVDDCPTTLAIVKMMLDVFNYDVTTCDSPGVALDLLQERSKEFDMVIADAHMKEMNGFQLLQALIDHEINIPFILLSSDERTETIIKGIESGIIDYLVKPGTMGEYKIIWQHVCRKQVALQNKKRDDGADGSTKIRVKWTTELHQKFSYAVNQLGIDKAVPKKILDLMNVPNLTKEHIASHLQKFRKYLKKNGLQQANQFSQEMLASMSAEMLPSTTDIGEGSGTDQNNPIIPENPPIPLQESSHPFNQQLPHFLPDQPLSTFQVEVQPQEWANFPQPTDPLLAQPVSNNQPPTNQLLEQPVSNYQPPTNPLLPQPVSNYSPEYNPVLASQAENIPIPIIQGPNYNESMGQMPTADLSGLNRPNTQNSDNPWLEFLDQEQARNPDFVGGGTFIATDEIGPRDLGNDEGMKDDFLSEFLSSPGDDLGPDV